MSDSMEDDRPTLPPSGADLVAVTAFEADVLTYGEEQARLRNLARRTHDPASGSAVPRADP